MKNKNISKYACNFDDFLNLSMRSQLHSMFFFFFEKLLSFNILILDSRAIYGLLLKRLNTKISHSHNEHTLIVRCNG